MGQERAPSDTAAKRQVALATLTPSTPGSPNNCDCNARRATSVSADATQNPDIYEHASPQQYERQDATRHRAPMSSNSPSFGVKLPPSTDNPDVPPDLFKSIQEHLGLKLEATKAQAKILVIDHVEKRSAS